MIAASLTAGFLLGLTSSAQVQDLPADTTYHRVEELLLYQQSMRTRGRIIEAAYCSETTAAAGDRAADRAAFAAQRRYRARTARLRDRLVQAFGADLVDEAEDFITFGHRCPAEHNQIYWHRRYQRELSSLERRLGL